MRLFILCLSISIFSACTSVFTPSTLAAQSQRPNIIFIMTDDHANRAVSCYDNSLIRTPNIDRIAREGVKFENSFVTNSICTPVRAILLTGKYSHLNGVRDNADSFDGSQTTFPKLLQQAGYQTAIIGKWHLKSAPTGFDHWNILIDQGEYYNPRMASGGDTVIVKGYTTDLLTEMALQYLDRRDQSRPFCLLLHHKAPHRNWMPHPRHFSLFENDDIPLPETFWDHYSTRSAAAREQDMRIDDMFLSYDLKLMPEDFEKETGTGGAKGWDPLPDWNRAREGMTPDQRAAWDAHYDKMRKEFRENPPAGKDLSIWKYRRYMQDYLRCVAAVDENVGKVLHYLDSTGLANNTLIVYSSDQGFYLGEHGWYDKRFMYEPSLRMPLAMRYPAKVKAGKTIDAMVLSLDFAPTFLDYAGAAIPQDMQGRSLRPLLEGKKSRSWRKDMYYQYFEYPGIHRVKRHYGIRTQRYKLIHFYRDIDSWELYDLKKDPNEVSNIYNNPDYQQIAKKLKIRLQAMRDELKVTE